MVAAAAVSVLIEVMIGDSVRHRLDMNGSCQVGPGGAQLIGIVCLNVAGDFHGPAERATAVEGVHQSLECVRYRYIYEPVGATGNVR